MGCSSSKDSVQGDEGDKYASIQNLGAAAHLPTTGPLSAKEYKARLATSEGTQTVHFPMTGVTIRYAFVSQRGYYPGSPDKANQDSLCVHTHFGGDPEQVFVGVFDGHGEYGTQCSQFAKDKVRAAWDCDANGEAGLGTWGSGASASRRLEQRLPAAVATRARADV